LSEAFVKRASELATKLDSRIVLALDPIFNPYRSRRIAYRSRERFEVSEGAKRLLLELRGLVPGVKMGLPIMIGLGPDEVENIVSVYKKRYFFICDLKMADIGHINRLVAEQVFGLGFDAIIIHAAIGAREGIDRVVELANDMNKGVLGLCAMSHPGAGELLNKNFNKLLSIAASAGVDGFVLPATYPKLITCARRAHPSKLVFSPGVGSQGACFGSALSAGADFEIIGRSIAQAPSPVEKVKEILRVMRG
jgi:orotidine-5'-phosphate decarboxylase